MSLPAHGRPAEEILDALRALREEDLPTHGGKLFAYVYDPGLADLDELTLRAHGLSAATNGLDPTAFPSLLRMENDIVAAAAGLLGGDRATVGNVTSGGTESVLLAVKAARDARPDVTAPRIVLPSSAHPAFAKAGAYLRVALDVVPVDPQTLRVSTVDIENAIGPDTVLVVASAPAYPHGVLDPVPAIAAAAARHGVRCHVDACFGGWLLPFWRELGVAGEAFDLTVPGVTSISVDLHKYAYCPKGVSVLLHRTAQLRAPQYFGYAGWPGYGLVNATVASTRPGGPIAAAWATLQRIGHDGYRTLAARTLEATRGLHEAVRAVPDLRTLLPEPESSVVAFTGGSTVDVFVVADALAAQGWHIQPQMAFDGIPRTAHLTVTAAVAPHVASFAGALDAAVAAARAAGPAIAELPPLDPAALTPDTVARMAAALGLDLAAGHPTQGMAGINAVLDAAPVAVREKLLTAVLDLLQRPSPQL
ncbi:aspartate aminotransferase family protein [Virgisporangium aliadipatigenens]|uniref:Aspartate aminotransferase family protein n=1 Tax=Virgisporangium aliadipatigenens TaxID=741659 RepID=A0A8J4DUJ5_9ACTN|nr:aspartate aminotransferase family protein [Virgisporangium aliadipatigenens]GIJ49242.1 aspartate aminotransferase family protein [Virgisporangium aliadipatigenens]